MEDEAGAVVAGAFVAGVRRDGFEPDPALRLLAWRPRSSPTDGPLDGPTAADAHDLGALHERSLAGDERTGRGVWYTPGWLAAELVARVVDGSGLVVDPACGGGAFLLAAADHLSADRSPAAAIDLLWGCDVDPLAVAVAEAALWWWSACRGEPTVSGHRLVVGDPLIGTVLPKATAVVGNPPFLGQLKRATAAAADRREALRRRFGGAVLAYTDEAWLFLLAAVESAEPGGRVALVQPRSLLAARDASRVREAIDEQATLLDVWLDDGSAFDAGVHVCAPVLERRPAPSVNDWRAPLVDALGIPAADLAGTLRLGDSAEVSAGFRDEYYGLVDAVREGGAGPALVTSGAIDPLSVRAGDIRFARRRWRDPHVDAAAVVGRAKRWVDAQVGPKLLVASQTRVIEAAVDPHGSLLGSVPVVVVLPHDPERLWHVAAALHAPVVTAWLLRRTAGTALTPDACKPTAAALADLPMPADARAWDEAARLARELGRTRRDGAHQSGGDASSSEAWAAFGRAADRAYGVTDGVAVSWWLGRLPVR